MGGKNTPIKNNRAVLGYYFTGIEEAQKFVDKKNTGQGAKFRAVVGKSGCLVVSEAALKNVGLLPQRKQGKSDI
jgi:hypothetical protein